MARVAIIVETPQLQRVGLPIVAMASYDIQHELNAAGAWVIEFPTEELLARSVKSRWRISIVEEGRPGYLLNRGIVTNRQFQLARNGKALLRVAGFTRLYGVARTLTHKGLEFDGTDNVLTIAGDLTDGATVTAPSVTDIADRKPEITFNDATKLQALIGSLEYSRLDIREDEDGEGFELVAWDDRPDSGYRFVSVEHAGPNLLQAAANGMGIIAGTPTIGYSGQDLANRLIPLGVDHDGEPLTLEHATLSDPYPVLSDISPDGSTFWYIEDEEAIYDSELIEATYVRSDVKNPNDNSADRTKAANAVYALAAGRLVQTKSDTLAFACEIANGRQVEAKVGDRVPIQFRGRARSFAGVGSWWDLDSFFLVSKRRDAATASGPRGVSFTLTAPEVPLAIPSLPEAVPIPPPPRDPPDPPDPSSFDDKAIDEGDVPSEEDPPLEPLPESPAIPDASFARPEGPTPYEPCCADQNKDHGGGTTPPPFDIGGGIPVPGCTVPWAAAAMWDTRFVDKWGLGWADPGVGDPAGALDPNRDVAIVRLTSASAPPVIVCSGADVHVLEEFDSSVPANFGGDGHNWWLIALVIPTAQTIDFTGTTGAGRDTTFMRAQAQLANGNSPTHANAGSYNSGVLVSYQRDLQYSGSHFHTAIENAVADQAVRKDDLLWLYVDDKVRTIDNITIDKRFHDTQFNNDAHFFNAEPVPFSPSGGPLSSIDWLLDSDRVDSVSAGIQVQADFNVAFEGSVRCLALAVTVKLTALCEVHLIA